jgi:cell division protein FtsI (penicillin-binding protein 3)
MYQKENKAEFKRNMKFLFIFISVCGLVLLLRLFQIMFLQKEFWTEVSKNSFKKDYREGERGSILSENGEIFAYDIKTYNVVIDPSCLEDKKFDTKLDSFVTLFAHKYPAAYSSYGLKQIILEARKKNDRSLRLLEDPIGIIDFNYLIENVPLFSKMVCRIGLENNKRYYPFQELARRSLGYVSDRKDIKDVGIEAAYDIELRGSHDSIIFISQPGGMKPIDDGSSVIQDRGKNVITTLDPKIQGITHNELFNCLKSHEAERGCAIVMETKTGKIRAMVNLSRQNDGSFLETFNDCIGTRTEPGSTFKMASMMALLEEGSKTLEDSVDVEKGKTMYFNRKMEDHELFSKPTKITLRRAFEISSNVGISKMVVDVFGKDEQKYLDYIRKFDLDKPTGIDLNGERNPLIREITGEQSLWSKTSLPWMSIGYESELTPIKTLTFYNSIANNGIMVKPYLVSSIIDDDGTRREFSTKILNSSIAHSSTITQLKSLLKGVVDSGTMKAYRKGRSYEFAGKTGTTQMDYANKDSKEFGHQASFVGYFPADKPIYTCIVVVYKPKNGYYGSYVSGETFVKIADRIFATSKILSEDINDAPKVVLVNGQLPNRTAGNMNSIAKVLHLVSQKVTIEKKDKQAKYGEVRANTDTLTLKDRNINVNKVPNVIGMGLKDAINILENMKLRVRFSGVGKVKSQSINPGTEANKQTIFIKLG